MGIGDLRRRRAWRQLERASASSSEIRSHRARTLGWTIWVLVVLVGFAVMLASNAGDLS
jgi:hypothetical protein